MTMRNLCAAYATHHAKHRPPHMRRMYERIYETHADAHAKHHAHTYRHTYIHKDGEVSSYTYGLYCARSDGVTAQIGGQP